MSSVFLLVAIFLLPPLEAASPTEARKLIFREEGSTLGRSPSGALRALAELEGSREGRTTGFLSLHCKQSLWLPGQGNDDK